MAPIRALLLDVGDTLFRLGAFPADLEARIARALGEAGLGAGGDAAAALSGLRRALEAAPANPSAVEVNVAAVVEEALAHLGKAPAATAGALVEQVAGEADVSRFQDGHLTPPVLRRLRALGLRLVAVSNTITPPGLITGHPVAEQSLAELDAMVFSVSVGVRKPGAEIYRQALALAGVAPGEAIFVGDRHREDVLGPMALGIRAVLTHQFRRELPGAGPQPLAIIENLAEIEAVVLRLTAT